MRRLPGGSSSCLLVPPKSEKRHRHSWKEGKRERNMQSKLKPVGFWLVISTLRDRDTDDHRVDQQRSTAACNTRSTTYAECRVRVRAESPESTAKQKLRDRVRIGYYQQPAASSPQHTQHARTQRFVECGGWQWVDLEYMASNFFPCSGFLWPY